MDVFEQGLFYDDRDGAFASADGSDNYLISQARDQFQLVEDLDITNNNIATIDNLIVNYERNSSQLKNTPISPYGGATQKQALLAQAKLFDDAIPVLKELLVKNKSQRDRLLKIIADKEKATSSGTGSGGSGSGTPSGGGTGSGTTSGGAGGGVGSGGTGGGVGSVTSGSGVGSGLGGLGLGSGLTDAGTTDDKKDSNKKLLIYGGIGVGVLLLVI